MRRFSIEANEFLKQDIQGLFHTDYTGFKKPENPDYINTLKNTYDNIPTHELNKAASELQDALKKRLGHNCTEINMSVSGVRRA